MKKIKGILVMEIPIMMLIFIFLMVLLNNGVVNLVREEWMNAAESGALAGAGRLWDENNKPTANQDAIAEASRIIFFHEWLGGPIDPSQVTITLGLWDNCIFTPTTEDPNAVRVDISPPMDEGGNFTGIMAFFGTIDLPFFQLIDSQITAVGAAYDKTAVLVEYQGNVCLDEDD